MSKSFTHGLLFSVTFPRPETWRGNKTKRDWLLYLSITWLLGRALAIQSSLKVWLRETTFTQQPNMVLSPVLLDNWILIFWGLISAFGEHVVCNRHTMKEMEKKMWSWKQKCIFIFLIINGRTLVFCNMQHICTIFCVSWSPLTQLWTLLKIFNYNPRL